MVAKKLCLWIGLGILVFALELTVIKDILPARIPVAEQIIIDQFGWRPHAVKVVLFANPLQGQNATVDYQPGSQFEVRRENDDSPVFIGSIQAWKGGAVDETSGDQVWWADFTEVQTPGTYYIYDPRNKVRSHVFEVRESVYEDVLKAAVRAFYYQRCGTNISTQFGGQWSHPPCHIGVNQDYVAEGYLPNLEVKDVHGGWHDAGDFNKYVPFTAKTIWNLINAYENNPSAFSDDYNIPESSNGVPDLLDEVKWELDWLLRMQMTDGSVANRVASHECNELLPQQDISQRYYTAPTTWATASLVVGTANAARVFREFQNAYPDFDVHLLEAAEKAWQYLERTPQSSPASGRDYGDQGKLSCASQADEEGTDATLRIWAAAELYRTTEKSIYKDYFDAHYVPLQEGRFDPHGGTDHPWTQQLAYVTYAQTPGADPLKVAEIKQAIKTIANEVNNLNADSKDPYRALIYDYYWGSNRVKADWGMTFVLAKLLDVDNSKNSLYEHNAEEYLHYIHGRNPLSWVYLSNMGEKGANLGADKSVLQIYHSWFHHGSIYDGMQSEYGPAPGFLVGGPNRYYSVQQVAPPFGEPPQKAYRDWNVSWNRLGNFSEASWEITEPAIYYQAAYVNLLSYFCPE